MQTKFKCTSFLRGLVLFLASATLLPAQALDFQVGNFHYWTNDTGVSVAGGYGISGDLVIPEKVTYNGVEYTVTGIWSSGFRSSSITSVVIPGTIKTIEKEAFSYCHELKTVTIAEGVPVIGSQMFAYCENLVSVNIPKSVTSIGDYAFMSCKSLPAAPIGKSVTTIGRSAFSGCSALTSADIPEEVTSIGESAFSSCTSLKSIVIPNSVTTVGTSSFYGCTGLESVVLGDGLTTIEYKCFENCTSLVNLTIGKNVSKLGTESFIGCSALETVTIPAKVTEITYTAFQNCAKLKNLIFSDGTESLHLQGTDIFDNCPLTKIYVGRDMTYSTDVYSRPRYTPLSHNENLTKVTVGNTVTKIGEGLFRNCPNLASVTFGNGITTIGSSAFTECPSLTSVIIPNNVTNIGGNALTYLQNLTLSDGPETLTLANSAFSGSPLETLHLGRDLSYNYSTYELSPFNSLASLRNLTIGENVSSLNTGLFKNCTALTTVTIPTSVTSIGQEAFSGCTALRSIVIPPSVTEILRSAFSGCSHLSSVALPSGLSTLAIGAFNTPTLRAVTMESAIPIDISAGSPFAIDKYSVLMVPTGSKRIYSHALGWDKFPTIIEAGEGGSASVEIDGVLYCRYGEAEAFAEAGSSCDEFTDIRVLPAVTIGNEEYPVTAIPSHAFATRAIESIEIPENAKLGENAFAGSSILTLKIPGCMTMIPKELCMDCAELKSVDFGSGITSIGEKAFYNCGNLGTAVIPTGVSSIGDQAFYKSGLRSVTIPASVKTMNGFIFSYSENLSEVIIADGTTNLTYNMAFETTGLESLYLGRNGDSGNGGRYNDLAQLKKICLSSCITKIPSFKNCPALAEVRVANPMPPKGEENAFSGASYYTCKLFVPVGSREAYESTKPWSYFLDIEETDEFPAEENLLFADNLSYTLTSETEAIVSACDPQAKEIVIPENLTFATSAIKALPLFSDNAPEGENVSFRIVGIGKDAFIGCVPTSLKVEPGTPLPCANVCFEEETLNNCVLTVPTPSIAAYAAAEVWKEFKTIEGASPVVEATSIEISAPGTTLAVGAELRMTATVLPEDTSDKTVEWSSSDTTKATVDESGVVKGLEPGTVVITATCGSVSDSIEIDVTVPSGIDNIEAGTTEATYYNIHGIKVENPTVPGVYILRNADGSAVKKIVK